MNGFWYRIRFPLLAAGMFSLLAGVYAGLIRAGSALPSPADTLAAAHGPLMVGGFLGTVIGLERAVALGAPWGYAAPAFAAAGTLAFLAGYEGGAAVLLLASLALLAIYGAVLRKQFTLFNAIMALGAAAWGVGNLLWLRGWPLPHFVLWWGLFLLLTIAGERLELSRFLQHPPRIHAFFAALCAAALAGGALATFDSAWGNAVAGAAFGLMALWLLLFDVARRTVRQEGLTRFVAVCLIGGYFWLVAAGGMLFGSGPLLPGYRYDALLHALFLGFVFSMIFGHAPIIFPAVLRMAVPFRNVFYLHLALLHLSLLIRVAGDYLMNDAARLAGAWLNAAALVLFLLNTVLALLAGRAAKGSASG